MVARLVLAVFAAVDRVMVEATLHYEAPIQAAAPELRRAVVERGRKATGMALATTTAK